MKKHSILFLFYFVLLSLTNADAQIIANNAAEKEAKILELVLKTIKEEHINPKKIDDEFSKKMFKSYIDTLDVDKLFFLQSDILEFKKFELKLDDQIKNNDLSFFALTRKRYLQRMSESKEIYLKILKGLVDFSNDENWEIVSKNLFCNTTKELEVRWTKFLKKTVIEFTRGDISANSSFEDFESETNNFYNQTLPNVLERSNYNVESINNEAVFTIFLNSFLLNFDPHTIYYSNPDYQKYFQSEIGVYNGFGFSFNQKNDFVTISNIDIGGPAWQTKKMTVGDVILKRAYDDEPAISFVGKSIFESSKIIQKKAPTIIHYTLKKQDGTIYEVSLKKGTIVANDLFVKSIIVTKNNHKYGLVSLPLFYKNIQDEQNESRNTTDDFKNELKNLQKENIEGLILDLRNNDGGNIEQVISIVSNFLPNGNILQYKEQNTKPIFAQTNNSEPVINKNLVVLVNSKTSSTAEIIAQILKEKNIALIAGQNTFGNNTIQKTINLDALKLNSEDKNYFGMLKVTNQKFYNLQGKSLQRLGVIVDVILDNDDLQIREKNLINSLPPDVIMAGNSQSASKINDFNEIVKRSKSRLDKNIIYKSIIIDKFKTERNNIKILNLRKYKKLYDNILIKYGDDPLKSYYNNLNFISSLEYQNSLKKKTYLIERRNAWLESLKTDFQIDESINILEDMLLLR